MGWLTGWSYRRAITLDNTGGDAQTDVQVRVALDALTFTFAHALSNGHDLRFTTADGTTLLDFWRQRWDATAGVAEAYVKTDLPTDDVVTVYVYYGNAGASDASSYDATMTKAVLDATSIFLAHCDEGSGVPVDATGTYTVTAPNSFTWGGTDGGNWRDSSPVQSFASGKYVSLNGTNQRLSIAGLLDTPPAAWSVYGWFRETDNSAATAAILRKVTTASPLNAISILRTTSGGQKIMAWQRYHNDVLFAAPKSNFSALGTHLIEQDVWYFFALTSGTRGLRGFINAEADVVIPSATSTIPSGSAEACLIGGAPSDVIPFAGDVDDIHFVTGELDDQQIADLFARRKPWPRATQYTRLNRSGSNPVISATVADEELDIPAIEEFTSIYDAGGSHFVGHWHGSGVSGRLIRGTSSDGITWASKTTVLGGGTGGESGAVMAPNVYVHPGSGTWYCFYVNNLSTSNLLYATSTDAGATWTKQGTANAVAGSTNSTAFHDGTNWHIFDEVWNGTVWRTGYYRGATLGSLSEIVSPDSFEWNLTPTGQAGNPKLLKIGSYWYCWGHANRAPASPYPSIVFCMRAVYQGGQTDLGLSGPWVELDGDPLVQPEDGVDEIDQSADFEIVEQAGTVYAYWTAGFNGIPPSGLQVSKLNAATFVGTLAELVAEPISIAGEEADTPSPPALSATATAGSTTITLAAGLTGGVNPVVTWTCTVKPAGATVTFDNAHSETPTATVTKAGAYTFAVGVVDDNLDTDSDTASATVTQTHTTSTIAPSTFRVQVSHTRTVTATALDQFGNALASQPAFTYSVTAGSSTINSSTGVFTANSSAETATVHATANSHAADATAIVLLRLPSRAGRMGCSINCGL